MVAIIKVSSSLHRIFNYNENKVKEGVAECIGAENYPLNPEELSLKIKLNFLIKRIALNENVKRNSLHISLNFDPSEVSSLTLCKLNSIAGVYMQKLGFGEQPYLVYQHHDAGHPHIHIVTTNIRADGSRIDLHHLGIRKSEPARKEIEKRFGLVIANDRQRQEAFRLKPIDISKVQYGRTVTKRAITNVLDSVLEKYRYTSLPELNALLGLYNVRADRGSENSKIFKGGGLVYRILDQEGKVVGVPIKASDFYNKPTLKYLETKYAGNEVGRTLQKARVRNAVDMALTGKSVSSARELVAVLEKQGISVVLRQNEAGLIYGVTYIDHETKNIFNGSALGKAYSAKGLQERCLPEVVSKQGLLSLHPSLKRSIGSLPQHTVAENMTKVNDREHSPFLTAETDMVDVLMTPEPVSDYLPGHLKHRRKRKKKRKVNNNA
jgi:hypothetical protein